MLFNSPEYFIFLAIVLLLYYVLKRQLIEQTLAKGIPPILVNMPLTDEYYGNFDTPQADYDLYWRALTAVAHEYNLPLIDLEGDGSAVHFTDEHFADFNHLNKLGAERLSRILADYYHVLVIQATAISIP